MTLSFSTFSNNFAHSNGGAIYASGQEIVSIHSTVFASNNASQTGGDFYSFFATDTTYFYNVSISDLGAASSIYGDQIALDLQEVVIEGNLEFTAQYGAALTCFNCPKVTIRQSSFRNLRGQYGGAVYIEQSDQIKEDSLLYPSYQIVESTFESNEAFIGGALMLENPQDAWISNCTFSNNSAFIGAELNQSGVYSGIGGGLFYTCTIQFNCYLAINDSTTFQYNFAENAGGGLMWDETQPTLSFDSMFINNSALVYGHHIASFAQMLVQISSSQYASNQNTNSVTTGRLLQAVNTNSTISSQQSGGTLPTQFIALVDAYNNIVRNDDSSKLTVRIDSTFHENDGTALMYAPVLQGQTQSTAELGVFNVQGVIFAGAPGSSFKIVFETDGIDVNKPSNKKYLLETEDNATSINFQTVIDVRECIEGESFT
mmetsp:Transcript_20833/g.19876  ORF Transcript_20833/g.19876 Transcript_20833/m.19876 type:complete len:430 (-) Transcript_20833:2711-4000(-)